MNDTIKLVGVGYLILVASLVAELLGSAAIGATGLVPPNATGSTWFWAVTVMMLIAAPLVLGASYLASVRLMKPRTAAEGLPVGLVWAGIVGLTHLLIGLGNGTLDMFLSPGTYVMVAAVVLGPWLAGRVKERQAV